MTPKYFRRMPDILSEYTILSLNLFDDNDVATNGQCIAASEPSIPAPSPPGVTGVNECWRRVKSTIYYYDSAAAAHRPWHRQICSISSRQQSSGRLVISTNECADTR